MKRVLLLAVLLLAGSLFCGCAVQIQFAAPSQTETAQTEPGNQPPDGEIRAVWVSYTELNPQKLHTKSAFRRRVRALLAPVAALSVTDVFLQVRPFADAIYPSKLFASSSSVVKKRGDDLPFDFLAVFLTEAKKAGLRVHAWINPYRVASSGNVEAFSNDPAIGPLLKVKGAPCVKAWDGGVFLDPASENVRELVLFGVRELLETYDLAGIHIDDYFYPTADPAFDAESYEAYRNAGGTDSLTAFREANVSLLVRALYQTVKSFGKEKIFSVSPAADIEKNETALCADVRRWGSEDGFCDWLIPQVYFGFQHETRPFTETVQAWRALCTGKNVRLLIGLAAYKIGKEDAFAGTGRAEWQNAPTILADQVTALRACGCGGFALFSVSFLNFEQKLSSKVLKNLKDVI